MSKPRLQQHLQKLENSILMSYPLLRQAGMYKPAKFGRTVLTQGQTLALFDTSKEDEAYYKDVAVYITALRLKEVFEDTRFKASDLAVILNQHFDFAELVLLHHSRKYPDLYKDCVEALEEKRGFHLKGLADSPEGEQVCWTEYAYWLIGRFEKLETSDPVAATSAIEEAEKYLRQAHYAGHV